MPISESCTTNCGARIDLVPGMALADAKQFVDEWRKDHRHQEGVAAPHQSPFGFQLPQKTTAISTDFNSGEDEDFEE